MVENSFGSSVNQVVVESSTVAVPESEYVKCNVAFSKNKIDSPVVVSSVIQVVVPTRRKNY